MTKRFRETKISFIRTDDIICKAELVDKASKMVVKEEPLRIVSFLVASACSEILTRARTHKT
jgi:hypothetical protein